MNHSNPHLLRMLDVNLRVAQPLTVSMGVALLLLVAFGGICQGEDGWLSWRGPLGTGEAPESNPPTRWSEAENIAWKTELTGKGHSSPIVVGQQIIITTAIPFGARFEPIADGASGSHDNLMVEQEHRFAAIAYDRETGEALWSTPLHEAIPHEGSHYTASLASASPTSDGTRIYCSFGSFGIYCLDLEGKIVWQRQLGIMNTKHAHGEGSSPILCEDKLIVNWDHEGESFLIALNKFDGETVWTVEREEVTSWSSPTSAVVDGQTQLIVAGTEKVRGYDLSNGSVIWECGGLSHNIVATPLVSDGILLVGSSYEIRAMLAIRLQGARGDITGSEQVLWTRDRGTPYVPSPLLYDGAAYYLSHYQGVLSRVELDSGLEPTGPFRLDLVRDVYASLAAADGRIYIVDRDGITNVLSSGEIPRILSRNRLDDRFSASPAFVGNDLILRGERFLYCLRDSSSNND